MNILKFLFGPFAVWAPTVFIALVVLILIWRELIKEKWFKRIIKKDFFLWERIFTDKRLIVGVLVAGFIFAAFLTVSQYYVWSLSAIGRFFLPPAQPTYFINYAFLHFWLGRLISLFLSLLIFGIFYLIRHYRRALSRAEINLVFLACLLAAWPRQVFLIPLFFLVAVLELISLVLIYRNKGFRETKIKIFWPLILATLLTLIFGGYLIRISGLASLIV
ncbi:MAG: hypothetical protein WC545_03205 [Patescibacteria group bacterium]